MVRNLKWQHFWDHGSPLYHMGKRLRYRRSLANHFLGTRNIVQSSMIFFFRSWEYFMRRFLRGSSKHLLRQFNFHRNWILRVPQPVRTNLNPNIRQDSTDWLNTSRSHGSFVKCPSLLSLSLQLMFFWLHRRTILRQTTTPVRRWWQFSFGDKPWDTE